MMDAKELERIKSNAEFWQDCLDEALVVLAKDTLTICAALEAAEARARLAEDNHREAIEWFYACMSSSIHLAERLRATETQLVEISRG